MIFFSDKESVAITLGNFEYQILKLSFSCINMGMAAWLR